MLNFLEVFHLRRQSVNYETSEHLLLKLTCFATVSNNLPRVLYFFDVAVISSLRPQTSECRLTHSVAVGQRLE